MRDLPALLQALDPQRGQTRLAQQVARARASFTLRDPRPPGHRALLLQLARFEHHLRVAGDGQWRPFPVAQQAVYEAIASRRLVRILGPGGLRVAARQVREGVRGGLRGLLNAYADAFVRDHGQLLARRRIKAFWQRLDNHDRSWVWRHVTLHLARRLPPHARQYRTRVQDVPRLLLAYPHLLEPLHKLSRR